MIKIQLCPPEELEDKHWYLTDVIVLLAIAACSFFSLKIYEGEIQLQVDSLSTERAQFDQRKVVLQDQLKKFKSLDEDIAYLKRKMEALKSITISKVQKFRYIVAMEHFQAIKPVGIWFRRLVLKEDGSFELKGGTLDNVLISELSLGLRETQTKSFVTNDVRSLVYFSNIQIIRAIESLNGENVYMDITKFVDFDMTGKISERAPTQSEVPKIVSQVTW